MKKKNKNSCIIVGEHKCKKIGSDLFYNLDVCLAIVIRDALLEFADHEGKVGCPNHYTIDEDGNDVPMKKACKVWRADIRRVAAMFDDYIQSGWNADDICDKVEKMFEALAEIFPALWI